MNPLHRAGSRRVVVFNDANGRSQLAPDDRASRAVDYEATPGMRTSILWSTPGLPLLPADSQDPVTDLRTLHPPAGGSIFLTLTLPPDSVYFAPDFDAAAASAEQLRVVPGIAERMEPSAPGFHTTDTVDYVIVLAGEVWLVVDDNETRLFPGDTVIQLGTRHAWQNRSTALATLAVVLMGAGRS